MVTRYDTTVKYFYKSHPVFKVLNVHYLSNPSNSRYGRLVVIPSYHRCCAEAESS